MQRAVTEPEPQPEPTPEPEPTRAEEPTLVEVEGAEPERKDEEEPVRGAGGSARAGRGRARRGTAPPAPAPPALLAPLNARARSRLIPQGVRSRADTSKEASPTPPVTEFSLSSNRLASPSQSPARRGSKLVVPVIVGTRPEAIKLVPIILRLRESEHYEPLVVSTGQHHAMVEYIFELARIEPDVVLWAGARAVAPQRAGRVGDAALRGLLRRALRRPTGRQPTPEDILKRPLPGCRARPRRHELGDGGGAGGLPSAHPRHARRGGPAHGQQPARRFPRS